MCLKVLGGDDGRWLAPGEAGYWAALTGVRRIANHNPASTLHSHLRLRLASPVDSIPGHNRSPTAGFGRVLFKRYFEQLVALCIGCGEDFAVCNAQESSTGSVGARERGRGRMVRRRQCRDSTVAVEECLPSEGKLCCFLLPCSVITGGKRWIRATSVLNPLLLSIRSGWGICWIPPLPIPSPELSWASPRLNSLIPRREPIRITQLWGSISLSAL